MCTCFHESVGNLKREFGLGFHDFAFDEIFFVLVAEEFGVIVIFELMVILDGLSSSLIVGWGYIGFHKDLVLDVGFFFAASDILSHVCC